MFNRFDVRIKEVYNYLVNVVKLRMDNMECYEVRIILKDDSVRIEFLGDMWVVFVCNSEYVYVNEGGIDCYNDDNEVFGY